MAKKESNFINMVLTLLIISIAASATLGLIYGVTKEPKAAAELAKKTIAIKKVVPEFDNEPIKEMFEVEALDKSGKLEFYPAKKGGELVGMAVKTFSMNGFSGYVGLMVGFKPDGTILNISVLEQKETPGLGTKMAEPAFKDQFNEKNPEQYKISVKKDGGDVDAITASTISSRAFCEATNKAYDAFMDYKQKNQ